MALNIPEEIPDTAEAMEAKGTEKTLPLGWVLLTAGLVLWGLVYLWLYSPALGGWSQAGAYERAEKAAQAEKARK